MNASGRPNTCKSREKFNACIKQKPAHGCVTRMQPTFNEDLSKTNAGAVITDTANSKYFKGNKLIIDNVHLAYAKATDLFAESTFLSEKKGLSKEAFINKKAVISDDVYVGPGCAIEKNVEIGKGSILLPNVWKGLGREHLFVPVVSSIEPL